MPAHSDGTFAGVAGGTIYWQAWLPEGTPSGVVVIAHGLAEHSGRYAHVADRLNSAGFGVYAIDHFGHGKSHGPRANVNRLSEVRKDLRTLIRQAATAHPDAPLFLLGHSMGGLIALDYVTAEDTSSLTGLALSGPVLDPTVGTAIEHAAAKILSKIAPNLGVAKLDSKAVSRDPAEVTKYESDPLNYHGKVKARTGAEIFAAIDRVLAGIGSVTLPVIAMHGTEDKLAASSSSETVIAKIGSNDKTLKLYDGLYHEIFNEPEKDAVLDDLLGWLEQRCR